MVFGDTWKENNFLFSRMNIYIYIYTFLLYDWKIWDGWEGQLKNAETFFFLLGRFLFLFLFLFG